MIQPNLRPAKSPGSSRLAGTFAAALGFLAAALLVPEAAQAATFVVSGTTLAINLTEADESVAITSAGSTYAFELTGGTWSGTDGGGATGDGTATLTATAASFTAVTVDDGSTGNAVTFNTSGANTYASAFTVTLDDATAGTITFSGNTAFAGSSALNASTSRNIVVASGAVVSVVNGNLTMSANQQVTPTAGAFRGIDVNGGTVTTSGTGAIALSGTGGDAGSSNHGINLRAGGKVTSTASGAGAGTITFNGTGRGTSSNSGVEVAGAGSSIESVSGNIQITATSLGTEDGNTGFYLNTAATVTSTGTGTTAANITINATAGNGTSNNAGFTMFGLSTANGISAVDGDITITGQGRGQGTLADGIRVQDRSFIRTTGDGIISLTGTASSDGGAGPGIWVTNAGGSGAFIEALGTGSVTLTGTGSGTGSENTDIYVNGSTLGSASSAAAITLNADTLTLDATSNLLGNASGSFTLQPRTAGRDILLGADDTASALGLTAAELARITVGNLTVGSATANSITVSAAITLPATTCLNLIATTITVGSNPITAGCVSLNGVGQPFIAIEQPAGTAIVNGVTTSFGNVVVGGTADLVITVRNTGSGDLTGLTITGLSGTDFSVITSPTAPLAPGGSTTFTIRFAPTSSGLKSAALTLNSNALGVPSFVINLVGSGAVASLAGTRSVGPTGDYASLTAAISAIQANNGPTGPLVLELQSAYLSTVETFPLAFSTLGTTAVNTLTIRPEAGATALSISSADTTAATVDLDGAQFVTIDGRPGGVGTAKQLTIENTSTSGRALRFINEASSNTLRYLTLRGVNTSTSSGTVVFSTTTGLNGNDNNTLDHCDIGDGASTPSMGLYSAGSTGTAAQANSGNTVSNCSIFNFYGVGDHFGVQLANGNSDWNITGNSFYQTVARSGPANTGTGGGIFISSTLGNNFVVANNSIGGSAPNAGGVAWTVNGTAVLCRFAGITLNVGTTAASSVQGNTVANITWLTTFGQSALPGIWAGIYVQAGSANIGTLTGNIIGSGTGTGSISVTTSGTGGTSFGIAAAGTGTRAIANNTIGSITTSGLNTTVSASLVGIQVTAGATTISDNTVGSTTTANSLNAATSSTSTTGQRVTGIFSSSTASAIITGNTVANLNNNYAGAQIGGHIRGIVTSAGVNTITGNTVRNLSTTSQNLNTIAMSATSGISGVGIGAISTAAGQTVSQNTVHSLANTAASAGVGVTGIFFSGPTTGANVIDRNFVHSLAVSSSSASSVLYGMIFAAGSFTAQNNLVRVGLDASGSSTAGASSVRGIRDNGTTEGRNFYHNSVYVGGTQTSGSASSRAFDGTSGFSNTRTYQNNLFVNARGNSGGTGKHYAVQYGGTTVNPTGLTAGGNLFLASGTDGVLGLYNTTDLTDLASWQTATGQDATSLSADPLYLSPTGTAATVDLHLSSSSPANNAGLALAAVTDDFAGGNRSLTTPDIGADEIGTAAPTAARDAATVTVAEGTTAFNSGTFADANFDTVTMTASVGTITQSAAGTWTHQQTLTQGGNPIDLVLDSQENLYVVNPAQNTLYKYNSSGSLVTSWTVTGSPTGVAVDSANGWLYVALKDGHRIDKFTLSGTLLTSWGSAGSGDGQFNLPHCVAVDVTGDVYVTDSFNSRIQVFSPAGTFLRKWGSAGSGNGQFNFPHGLRVSAGGTLYVADRNNHRVQYFDTAGTFLGQWGSNGSGDGQFNAPAGIGIDPGGNIVVGDISNNRIQKFTANGTFVDKLGPSTAAGNLALPHGVAFPSSGRSVYIADFNNGRVLKFATPGGWNWSYTPADSAAGPITVTITATDNEIPNLSSTTTFTLNVNNVAPTIALTGNATVPNGTPYTLNLGAVTDPGADTVSAFSINWGDGSTENFTGNPASTTRTHTYATLGAKTITVTLTDEDGTVTGGTGSVTVENAAPVAGADSLNRPNTTGLAKVLKTTLLANDSDADLDPLTLTAVGNALPAGATVAIAGNFVVYTAPANNAGNGSFTYTLSAGTHTVTGTVTVTETTTAGGGGNGNPNALAIVPSGADFEVIFVGVPGGSYRVQYTTSSGQPYTWNEFDPPAVVTAAANGVIPHTDVNPPDPMRLYRAVSHP